MEVVVLAGGFGTRMRPLTYTRPKPLLPLLNRPLLANIIDRLPKRTTKIVLPVGYLREQIEAYFDDHPDPRVILVEETEPLGTGGAIKNCERHLTGPFFVYNGDCVSSIDLDAMWEQHHKRKAEATISLWPVKEPWHFGVVELGEGPRIRKFVEKPPKGQEPTNLINAGNYLLNREVLDHIPADQFFSIEKELYQPWAQDGHRIDGFKFQGYWIDCGRPESLLEAHATVLAERKKSTEVAKGVTIPKDAKVEGYAIAEECTIGTGASIQRTVVMKGSTVGRKVRLVDTILGEGVEIEEGAALEGCVVGDYGVVEAGARIKNERVGMRPGDA